MIPFSFFVKLLTIKLVILVDTSLTYLTIFKQYYTTDSLFHYSLSGFGAIISHLLTSLTLHSVVQLSIIFKEV